MLEDVKNSISNCANSIKGNLPTISDCKKTAIVKFNWLLDKVNNFLETVDRCLYNSTGSNCGFYNPVKAAKTVQATVEKVAPPAAPAPAPAAAPAAVEKASPEAAPEAAE